MSLLMAKECEEYLKFEGNIYYHKSIESINDVSKRMIGSIDSDINHKIIVGFDCEWDVKPFQSKVCLIQMCFKSDECHLFQLSSPAINYTIPPSLQSLILHQNCIKVGLNIENDIWKLQRDYGLRADHLIVGNNKSVIDLSLLANQLLGKTMRWSLNDLSLFLFNKAINKDLRLSKWSTNPLTKDQQNYAAIDAFASYELYYAIKAKAHSFD